MNLKDNFDKPYPVISYDKSANPVSFYNATLRDIIFAYFRHVAEFSIEDSSKSTEEYINAWTNYYLKHPAP